MPLLFTFMMQVILVNLAVGQAENTDSTKRLADTAEIRDIIDTAPWAQVLKLARADEGVRYALLRDEAGEVRGALERFVGSLEAPIPDQASRDARLAYWINAYNALTIKHVLRFPRLESVATAVQGAPRYAFFKQRVHRVAGALRSLDDIEHKILRPEFRDPRVHAALNCASRSCPPLAAEPFRAGEVGRQLDEAARRFVRDASLNQISEEVIRLSKIFNWFAEDFGGERGVIAFIKIHALPKQRALLERALTRGVGVSYRDYDWSLNEWSKGESNP